tara:strand:- start:182 stop:937 length:756 start_codon:yes stop_codon:yes gene_type:complete
MNNIYLHASEIASLIGKNPYNSVEDAIEKIKNRIQGITEDHSKIFNNLDITDINNIMNKLGTSTSTKITEDNKNEVIQNIIDNTLIKSVDVNDTNVSKNIEANIINSITTATDKNIESIKEYINSNINKKRGINAEPTIIQKYQDNNNKKIKHNNSKLYKLYLFDNIYLCGKIDGIEDDYLIEVKNRRNRLFKYIPEYEQVQIECYLRLTNLTKAKLIENYNELQNIQEYEQNDNLWIDIITTIKKNIKYI